MGAIAYGGWLAVRRSQRRAAREAAADEETDAAAPVEGCDRMDEAMNRLGRDWRPEHDAAYTLNEFLKGLREGAGADTAPLAPDRHRLQMTCPSNK